MHNTRINEITSNWEYRAARHMLLCKYTLGFSVIGEILLLFLLHYLPQMKPADELLIFLGLVLGGGLILGVILLLAQVKITAWAKQKTT